MSDSLRLAMWSGPRNISTAMLRSWGERADTFVCDEPLYAHYLRATGLPHPGADEVLAAQENDWRKVVAGLTGPVPGDRPVFYQKHMAHHLLPQIARDWLDGLTHAFLIRDPSEMLPSLARNIPEPRLEDTGLPQQVEILDWVQSRTGTTPPVLDSKHVLTDPRGQLGALCESVGLPFDEGMLSWPPGRRETDGVWAPYWYDAVERSTSFAPYAPKTEPLPDHLAALLEECRPHYERLYALRLGS